MTKLSIAQRVRPREEGRAAKAFQLLWGLLCWVTAFGAIIVAWAALHR
ncbi:MAG TPA: hypothetical protein VKU90_07085 [Caulobacteraceae bacterium]|nr:hypothetical protein [Caulobacteraceae bacterium]